MEGEKGAGAREFGIPRFLDRLRDTGPGGRGKVFDPSPMSTGTGTGSPGKGVGMGGGKEAEAEAEAEGKGRGGKSAESVQWEWSPKVYRLKVSVAGKVLEAADKGKSATGTGSGERE